MFTLPLKVLLLPDTMLVEGYVKCQFQILLGSVSIKHFFPNNAVSLSVTQSQEYLFFTFQFFGFSLQTQSRFSTVTGANEFIEGRKKKIKANTKHLYNRQKLITIMLIKNMFVWFFFLSKAAHFKSMLLFLAKKAIIWMYRSVYLQMR